jgi:hypothetical protein
VGRSTAWLPQRSVMAFTLDRKAVLDPEHGQEKGSECWKRGRYVADWHHQVGTTCAGQSESHSTPHFGCVPWSDAKYSPVPPRSLVEKQGTRSERDAALKIKVDDFTGHVCPDMYFLTHAHSDHMGGLMGQKQWSRYVETFQHRPPCMLQCSFLSLSRPQHDMSPSVTRSMWCIPVDCSRLYGGNAGRHCIFLPFLMSACVDEHLESIVTWQRSRLVPHLLDGPSRELTRNAAHATPLNQRGSRRSKDLLYEIHQEDRDAVQVLGRRRQHRGST